MMDVDAWEEVDLPSEGGVFLERMSGERFLVIELREDESRVTFVSLENYEELPLQWKYQCSAEQFVSQFSRPSSRMNK